MFDADGNVERSLTLPQLAKRWKVSQARVRAMVRKGLVAAFDVGTKRRAWRFSPEAIREAEGKLTVKQPPRKRRRKLLGIAPDLAAKYL